MKTGAIVLVLAPLAVAGVNVCPAHTTPIGDCDGLGGDCCCAYSCTFGVYIGIGTCGGTCVSMPDASSSLVKVQSEDYVVQSENNKMTEIDELKAENTFTTCPWYTTPVGDCDGTSEDCCCAVSCLAGHYIGIGKCGGQCGSSASLAQTETQSKPRTETVSSVCPSDTTPIGSCDGLGGDCCCALSCSFGVWIGIGNCGQSCSSSSSLAETAAVVAPRAASEAVHADEASVSVCPANTTPIGDCDGLGGDCCCALGCESGHWIGIGTCGGRCGASQLEDEGDLPRGNKAMVARGKIRGMLRRNDN